MSGQTPQVTTRDNTYYIENGETCVFQAENCLFRIHRYHIERWPSVFKTMLSLEKAVGDNPTIPLEGRSDDNPIVCEDTAENFRALCWILYASPKEICTAHLGDVRRLVALASITHKYEFTELEHWVLELLGDKVPDKGLAAISVSRLETLLFITTQTKRSALAAKVQNTMIARIQQSRDPLRTLATIIPIAERMADGMFQAKLYYAYLRAEIWKGGSPSRITPAESTVSLDNIGPHKLLGLSGLTEHQRLKLHCGYYSLMLLRMRLQRCPQALLAQNSEGTDDWWASEISQYGDGMYDDPGKLLEEMLARTGWGSSWFQPNVFTGEGTRHAELKKLKGAFDRELANRFMCS